MTADWTTCRVVRDRDGDLWFRGHEGADADMWTASTDYPDTFLSPDEVVTAFGPLVPVLDADGVPVVTTVGDLTARHIGKRVRVDYYGDGVTETISVERVKHYGYGTNLGDGCGYLDLDTTCELLP